MFFVSPRKEKQLGDFGTQLGQMEKLLVTARPVRRSTGSKDDINGYFSHDDVVDDEVEQEGSATSTTCLAPLFAASGQAHVAAVRIAAVAP
ncbi:hypothetical protein RB195_022243 [Necator americanus]|uniref:Uncharacterized protein n=1 Tax=Necator americanus TaxID=51031 RepID=A0ABR1EEI6_NECAM